MNLTPNQKCLVRRVAELMKQTTNGLDQLHRDGGQKAVNATAEFIYLATPNNAADWAAIAQAAKP